MKYSYTLADQIFRAERQPRRRLTSRRALRWSLRWNDWRLAYYGPHPDCDDPEQWALHVGPVKVTRRLVWSRTMWGHIDFSQRMLDRDAAIREPGCDRGD